MLSRERCLSTQTALTLYALVALLAAALVTQPGVGAQVLSNGFSMEFVYLDSGGPGTATITAGGVASDSAAAITVTITQNGATYSGQGTAEQQDPQRYALVFTVADPSGNTYSFRGTLQMGVDSWSGEGTWRADYDPAITDRWTMTSRTPTPPSSSTPLPSGSEITLANDGETITLNVGDSVLLRLGDEYAWSVSVEDMNVVRRVIGVSVVRGAQGLFRANAPGQTTISASGDPVCRAQQPACALPSRFFRVTLVVQ